jgi:hypothetical protein
MADRLEFRRDSSPDFTVDDGPGKGRVTEYAKVCFDTNKQSDITLLNIW